MVLITEIVNLSESPMYDENWEIDSEYLDTLIIDEIKLNIKKIVKVSDNVFKIPISKIESIYFYANINDKSLDVLAGVYGNSEFHDNKHVFITGATKKYDSSFASATLKLYSWISKNSNFQYIMSDGIHSTQSKINWLNWLNDPSKYGISEIYLYDIKNEVKLNGDIDEYWCNRPECENYRVIVKF